MPQIRDIALDADGDIAVVNGDFASVADLPAVEQGIAIRLRFFFGENWLDETKGLPYVDQTLADGTAVPGILSTKNPDPRLIRSLLQSEILDTPDTVEAAGSELIESTGRQARVAYAVSTAYTRALLVGEVGVP